MELQEMLKSMSERLETSANVRNVYGEPIHAGDKVIVPVARVAYGLGGGTGPKTEAGLQGAGGGAGVKAEPVGIVEVTRDETRVVPFTDFRKLGAAAAFGFILGVIIARRD